MDNIEMICLAVSRKTGGKCVAGIDLKTGEWVRPVRPGGQDLTVRDIEYEDGSTPQLLDIISVPVIRTEPLRYQPENIVIDPEYYWEKRGRYKVRDLEQFLFKGDHIFGDFNDRLSEVAALTLNHSLTLVRANGIWFIKRPGYREGTNQVRAKFKYKGNEYNLVVTDGEWEVKINDMDYGVHLIHGRFNLTISLGLPFEGLDGTVAHYKLVAGITEHYD